MYQQLINHIRKFVPLNDKEETILLSYLQYQKLTKKELLLKESQVCSANHFVLTGCCCLYMHPENGTEQIIQFGIENWWITDYVSLDSGKPSTFNIKAVENSLVAILRKGIQDEVFAQIPQLERYFRLILQRAYAASMMRMQFNLTMSKEERYRHFSNLFPQFVQRIPQYMLASYLGFTPEFLSKIRAKKE